MKAQPTGSQAPFLRRLWAQRSIQIFALSGLVYLFIFNIIPMMGLLMAFEDYQLETGLAGIFSSRWVGFAHFLEFFHEYKLGQLLRNTICISLLKLVFTFPMPIIFAICLSECPEKGFKRLVQTTSYLPYFISWVIVSGFLTLLLNTQNGTFNTLLMTLGIINSPFNFLANAKTYWPMAVLSGMWKEMGWWAILFLAAITGIDPELYDAAKIDGAGRMQRILHVTFPGILPTIMVVLILSMGGLFGGNMGGSNFDQSLLLGNAGNFDTSDIIQTYTFRMGLAQGRYDYATAVGMIQGVISVIMILGSNAFSKKLTGTGLY
jgi:putative aldouronate transport system permease protein